VKPLATYTERLFLVRRDFFLYEDRVAVKAHWLFKGRFETTVKLSTLKVEPRVLNIRYRVYRYAGWVLAIGLLGLAIVLYNTNRGPIGILGQIAVGVSLIGGAAVAATYPNRRIRFVRFDAVSGRGGLDIGLAGNDVATFEAFVNHVRRQVRKQDRSASAN
jgi:hypothetical protein